MAQVELMNGWCERVDQGKPTYTCEKDGLMVREIVGLWVCFRHGRPITDGFKTPEEAMRIGGGH